MRSIREWGELDTVWPQERCWQLREAVPGNSAGSQSV